MSQSQFFSAERPVEISTQRADEEVGHLFGPQVAHVAPRIPRDAGLIPVLPEALCLIRKGQPVAIAGEDEPAAPGHLGLEGQRRHHAVDVLGGAAHDLVLDRSGPDVVGAVSVEQAWEIRYRDPRHHSVDALHQSGQERNGVRAQRDPVQADRCGSLLTDESNEAPDVPYGLRQAVHGVHQLEGEERLPAHQGDPARTMERQRRECHVHLQLVVEPVHLEPLKVHERETHAKAVHGDNPGAGIVGVAHDDGRGGPVRFERHPPVGTGLARMGGEPAVPVPAVVAQPRSPSMTRRHVGLEERRRGAVIGVGLRDPTSPFVQGFGLGELAGHPGVVPGQREPPGCHGHGQQRLVHRHLSREAEREVRRRHGVAHFPAQ